MLLKLTYWTGISLSGLLCGSGIWEFYTVSIKKDIDSYPFGGEGPVPYYYKTAELYSGVNLTWGIVFLFIFIIGIWNWNTEKISQIKFIGLTFTIILLQITHNMYGYII